MKTSLILPTIVLGAASLVMSASALATESQNLLNHPIRTTVDTTENVVSGVGHAAVGLVGGALNATGTVITGVARGTGQVVTGIVHAPSHVLHHHKATHHMNKHHHHVKHHHPMKHEQPMKTKHLMKHKMDTTVQHKS